MKLHRIALGFCILLLTAGVALAQKVNVQNQPGTDWSKYKTYAWGECHKASNPMTDQFIVAQVNSQLAAHGLTPATENPDLLVMYHVASSQSLEWNSFGGFRGFGMQQGTVNKIVTGELAVQLADPAGKLFVWQGTTSETVGSDASKNEKNIQKGLEKMFSNFPNPPK
jgi:Domain of unknown function (DUF4136)